METSSEQKPFVPASSVEYARHSIVSREILRRDGGSVTLFAFDAGQQLSEHTTSFDALLSVVEGSATVFINRNMLSAKVSRYNYRPGCHMLCVPINLSK